MTDAERIAANRAKVPLASAAVDAFRERFGADAKWRWFTEGDITSKPAEKAAALAAEAEHAERVKQWTGPRARKYRDGADA